MECNLLYVYGILKRGYAADLSKMGAEFVSEATMQNSQLYWIGKDRMGVGLRFEFDKGPSHGEIWQIPDDLWEELDWMEGVKHGVYARRIAYAIENCGLFQQTCKVWAYEHTYFKPEEYDNPIPSNSF